MKSQKQITEYLQADNLHPYIRAWHDCNKTSPTNKTHKLRM